MKGITTYKTRSGFAVARVHYTADPDKDPTTEEGMKWLKKALMGVPGGMSSSSWQKEMEIDFSARAGQRVFPGLELLKELIFIPPFQVPDIWEFRAAYDFGKRNPFSYHDYAVGHDQDKYAIYEAYGSGYEIPMQAAMMKRSPYFEKSKLKIADPSIWTEDQVAKDGSYTSFQRIFSDMGIIFDKGKTSDIAAVERLEQEWYDFKWDDDLKQLVKLPKKNPTFRIFQNCPELWNELINLTWSDYSPTVEQTKGKKESIEQVKNHAWDDLKYFILSLPQAADIPKPRSNDRAKPLAGELLDLEPFDNKKWLRT